jgi:hypothetical protein
MPSNPHQAFGVILIEAELFDQQTEAALDPTQSLLRGVQFLAGRDKASIALDDAGPDLFFPLRDRLGGARRNRLIGRGNFR